MKPRPAALFLAVAAVSCSGSDGRSSAGPCDGCESAGEVCVRANACEGGVCVLETACARRCSASAPCAADHACVTIGGESVCHPDCSRCEGRVCFRAQQCAGGLCGDMVLDCTARCSAAAPCTAASACTAYEGENVCDPRCAGCAACFRDSGTVIGCATRCDTGACPSGHPCVSTDNGLLCDPRCRNALCAPRTSCSAGDGASGDCIPVKCSASVACAVQSDFCDAGACYPLSGECETTSDCPLLDGRAAAANRLGCEMGMCHLEPPAPEQIPALAGRRVSLLSPEAGTAVPAGQDLLIRWEYQAVAASLVLVLDDRAETLDDVSRSALWGAAVPAGDSAQVQLSQGQGIQDGRWTGASAVLPTGEPLYVVVQTVFAGKLIGSSPLVPFMLGGGWRGPGLPCPPDEAIPGHCENPHLSMACISGTCRLLCASQRDCVETGMSCGVPRDGLRICE